MTWCGNSPVPGEISCIFDNPTHLVFFSRRLFPNLLFGTLLGHVSQRESPAAPPVEKRRCSIQSANLHFVWM